MLFSREVSNLPSYSGSRRQARAASGERLPTASTTDAFAVPIPAESAQERFTLIAEQASARPGFAPLTNTTGQGQDALTPSHGGGRAGILAGESRYSPTSSSTGGIFRRR